jgi:hypothetical protein
LGCISLGIFAFFIDFIYEPRILFNAIYSCIEAFLWRRRVVFNEMKNELRKFLMYKLSFKKINSGNIFRSPVQNPDYFPVECRRNLWDSSMNIFVMTRQLPSKVTCLTFWKRYSMSVVVNSESK